MARPKGSKNKGGNGASTTPPTTEVTEVKKVNLEEALNSSFEESDTPLTEADAEFQVPVSAEVEASIDASLGLGIEGYSEGDSIALKALQELGVQLEGVRVHPETTKELLESTITDSEYQGSQEALNAPESNVEPIEAIVVEGAVTHSLTISGVHLNQVVSELLKAAYCGATLTPKKLPRLSKLPYQVAIQIDDDGYNEYMDSNSGIVYDEQEEYNHLVVSNPDPLKFVQEIMAIGAKGAVIPDRKSCTHIGGRYQVKLATCKAIAPSANVKVKAKKRIYTRDELHAMKMADLKIIAGYYKMTLAGNRAQAVKQLLEKQAEITQ